MIVNIGVIGCGYWGKNLIRNFNSSLNSKLCAICDLNKHILKVIKNQYPALKTYTNYKDLIKCKDIDAFVVSTPVKYHYKIAKEALLSDKHVFIEKPFVSSVREAEELASLAEKKNRILMVDHTFIYTGAVRKIKELIDKKEIGDILYYDSVRINLGLFQEDVNVAWDLAPHDLSVMDFLLDKKPVSVSAVGASHFTNGIENVVYLLCKFKNELIAHFHFNWLSPVKVRLTMIGGSKKMIVYDDTQPSEKVRIYDKGVTVISHSRNKYKRLYDYRIGDIWSPKVDLTEALIYVCKEFIDSITEKRPPISDGASGVRIVRILEAINRSIRNNGKEIKL